MDVARRVCAAIEREPLLVSENLVLNLTVSAGVGTLPDDGKSGSALVAAADKALYAAKARGRNRAVGFNEL